MKKVQTLVNKLVTLTLVSSYLVGGVATVAAAQDVAVDSTSVSEVVEKTETTTSSQESKTDSQNITEGEKIATDNQTLKKTDESIEPSAKKEEKDTTKKKKTVPIQILGINDFHGAINTTGSAYLDSKLSNVGKAAYLSAELDNAEQQFKQANQEGASLRVQAGDLVGASPSNSALLQDEPTIKIMNRLNIKLGILGNHEFDEGLPEFNRIIEGNAPIKGSVQDTEIINNYPREKSNMKILSANVLDKATQKSPFGYAPYTIETFGDVKVGFIGVVTDEIPNLVLAQHVKDYTFIDPAQAIVDNAKELRSKGVNAIVVIGHTGASGVDASLGGETTEIIAKMNQLDPENSVDAFFAGHSHTYANGVYQNVRVIQGTSQGKAFSNVMGDIDVETQDFVDTPKGVVSPVLTDKSTPASTLKPNAEVQAIVTDADERISTLVNEVIGKTSDGKLISRDVNNANEQESALGNLITDGQLQIARETFKDDNTPIDFAITNNGGIRADLQVTDNGDITWGAAQAVQPFGNVMQVVSIKGADLIEALNQQFIQHYFLQVSGMSYTFTGEVSKNADGTTNDTRKIKDVTVISEKGDKTPLKADKTYKVVINDFLFGGGDGFAAFTKGTLIGELDPDTNIFVNYIKSQKTVSAKVEGRKKQAAASNEKEKNLTILGTTDVHGNIWNYSYEDNKEAGNGLAKVATYANSVREEKGKENVILVDNGDIIQGTILTDDLYNVNPDLLKLEHPIIKAMNVIGYDSMTLGNHEFNFGQDVIKKLVKEATFPLLSANTYIKKDGKHLVEPYTVVEKNGLKVAILGMTVPDVPLWDGPRVEKLTFKGLEEEAKKQVKIIEEKEKPDVIIASIHAGLDNSRAESAAINVVKNVTEIDAFIVGHDHKTIATKIKDANGVEKPVAGSKDTGSEMSRIELDMAYNDKTNKWEIKTSTVEDVNLAKVEADNAVKEATKEAHDATIKYIKEEIGQASDNFLPEQQVPGIPEAQMAPTALISLINNVQLKATKADVAAASLFKADSQLNKGSITYSNIFDIYKYANTLVGVEITGKHLKEFMEDSAKYYNQYKDGDLTVSFGGSGNLDSKIRVYNYDMFAGVDYQIDVSKPVGQRIINPTIKGKPIDDNKEYKLAINNYRYGNLQKNGWVTKAPYFDTDPDTLRGLIASYIKDKKVIHPKDEIVTNWELVGADGLTHFLRPVMIDAVKNGILTIESTPNNRTPNINTLTINDLIEKDLVGRVSVSTLEKDIQTAEKLNDKNLKEMLKTAKKVLAEATALNSQLGSARDDNGQAQAIIDQYTKNLQEAVKKAENDGQTDPIVKLDLSNLEDVLVKANKKEEARYEKQAWHTFSNLIKDATNLLEQAKKEASSTKITQKQVDDMTKQVTEQLATLEKHVINDNTTQESTEDTISKEPQEISDSVNNQSGNSSSNSKTPYIGSQSKPTSTKNLPKTGEKKQVYSIIGLSLVLGTSTIIYIKKTKKVA
ncbi:5'-nucleotidase C-terminal domain-containing protein [Vagococcus bubulae]|uniref:Gram-positive cocci surface proteins LPxTG domain-containing protein n=1 Tax=Vagococcus bubulae TaxID=1977868 RepID=A0A429ZRD5_9ENTE|nr:5'-nucleotidase C-terminal domain-containing protein [Vagococcus bubulae]RST96272.1 hypothetical protein CBF36_00650 [Vagococcus bubulae]